MVLGDFNVNLMNNSNSYFQHIMSEYELIDTESTPLGGSLLDHAYAGK